MKAKYLFPRAFRIVGLIMAIPGFVLGYLTVFKEYEIPGFTLRLHATNSLFVTAIENYTNELALALVIIGLVFIAFSKIKQEDELTAKLRLNALYWAILINYIICFSAILVLITGQHYDLEKKLKWFITVFGGINILVYNLFMPLVIFIARFYYLLYKDYQTYEVRPLRFLPHRPYSWLGKLASVACFAQFLISHDIDSVGLTFLPLALLPWVYSREQHEDELISTIRLDAMQIAVYVNYAILMIANCTVYSLDFWLVLSLNMATIPIIFLLVFYIRLWRLKRNSDTGNHLTLGVL